MCRVPRLQCLLANSGQRRWERRAAGKRRGVAAPRRLCSVPAGAAAAAAAAPPLRSGLRPSGLSVHGLCCRGSRRQAKEPPQHARNQLARSPRAREWSPQHDKLHGGNDEGPPATQNISPQPSGVGRARHEPPARLLAVARSRPRDRRQAREARARASTRPEAGVCESGRCGRRAASSSRPAGRPGTEAREERVRSCGGGGASPGLGSVSQVLAAGTRLARASRRPWRAWPGRPPVDRRLPRLLRRYLRPGRRGEGDTPSAGFQREPGLSSLPPSPLLSGPPR